MLRFAAGLDRPAVFLYGATLAANILAFGYQFAMARLLGPADYAILIALFGYLIVEGISTQVVQSATARLAAHYLARGDEAALHAFAWRWLRRIAPLAAVPSVALVVLAAPLAPVLALPPATVALLGVALFGTGVLVFTQGLLQGLRRFGWLGTVLLIQAAFRVGLGVALVLFGGGVVGAMIAAAGAPLVGVAVSLVVLLPLFRLARGAVPVAGLAASETRFFALAAVVLLAYAALTNVDAVLARVLLTPLDAGAYAGAVALGKIVLFAPIAVALILLERTARAHARGEDTDVALFVALAFVLATSGAVAVAYLWRPALFVTIVVGPEYPASAALVGRYGIAALANALLSLWIAYFIGRGEMRVGVLLAIAVAAEVGLLFAFARDGSTMVWVVLGVALATQVAAIVTFVLGRMGRATSTIAA